MALRKASAYSRKFRVAYTRRSSVRSKNYIKTVPQIKIMKFVMGDIKKFLDNRFNYLIEVKSEEDANIRDNAIESARQIIHRHLEEQFKGNYYFALTCYPHHILRENKMLTGAGADRMQTGMSLSFGSSVGVAVQIKEGKKIFMIAVSNEKDVPFVRRVIKKALPKLPCRTKVFVTAKKKKHDVESEEEIEEEQENEEETKEEIVA